MSELMEHYEEHQREVADHLLTIVAYKLGTRHVCIISNQDPGATICRVASYSRDEALRMGLAEASARLAKTVVCEVPPKRPEPSRELSRLEYSGIPSDAFSVADFLALDAGKRVQYILSGMLAYFADDGETIPPAEAMQQLRQACAA